MKEKNIDEKREQLENLGIHDLRNIARMWGVKSPTMKVKETLIDEILAIITGKKEYTKPKRLGRPTKNTIVYEKLQEEFFPNKIKELVDSRQNEEDKKMSNFFVFEREIEQSELSNELENREGIIRCYEDFCYIVGMYDKKITYIPGHISKIFDFEKGDDVILEASYFKKGGFYVATNVIELNGQSTSENRKEMCDFLDVVLPRNNEVFLGINEGEFKLTYNPEWYEVFKEHKDFLYKKVEEGFKIVVSGFAMSADGELKLEKFLKSKNILSFMEFEPIYSFEAVEDTINYVYIHSRSGEKILLFLLDTEIILRELDLHYIYQGEKKEDKHCYNSMVLLRKLTSLNRCLVNGGSVTICAFTSNEDDEFLKHN